MVPIVERLHDVSQNRRVLSTRGADGDEVSRLEQPGLDDGEVDLRLERVEETFLAKRVARFGSLELFSNALIHQEGDCWPVIRMNEVHQVRLKLARQGFQMNG